MIRTTRPAYLPENSFSSVLSAGGGRFGRWALAAAAALLLAIGPAAAQPAAEHVIHISVDGLRPDAITRQGAERLPNFYRLRREGAFTDNARTDVDFCNTLPNHVAQLTGRPVLGDFGHNWTTNRNPRPGQTLHSHRGAYVASSLDVAHDSGLRTGVYVSKSKFVLLDRSYDALHGAPDVTGEDDGRDKIDVFVYDSDTDDLVERFISDMREDPHGYAFLHLKDPDAQGHMFGWRLYSWHPYMRSIRRVDALLGQILELVDSDPRLAGRTAIILTSDHGGSGHSHSAGRPEHYTVPFYVWGAGVAAGDLYVHNNGLRGDPRDGRPTFEDQLQPIRNGAAANLGLSLLGLEPVPGSSINTASLMRVRPAQEGIAGAATAAAASATR